MTLKQQIVSDLTAAMKAKDAARLSVLRMVKAAVMNREIDKGGELGDDETVKLLQTLVKQRRDSIQQYTDAGRADLLEKEQAEVAVIEGYLPQTASVEAVDKAVIEAIQETGASSPKDMGTVMKAALAKLAGSNPDNKTVSETVKAKLQS